LNYRFVKIDSLNVHVELKTCSVMQIVKTLEITTSWFSIRDRKKCASYLLMTRSLW